MSTRAESRGGAEFPDQPPSALEVQELAPRLRAVGREARIGRVRDIRSRCRRDGVARQVLVAARRPAPDRSCSALRPNTFARDRRRDLRDSRASRGTRRDLERAERLDLVLRGAVPDRVGAPQHVVLAEVREQLAERVRGRVRIAHQEAPGRAELGVDVAALAEAAVAQARDQRVDAVGALRVVRAFGLVRRRSPSGRSGS